MNNVARDEYVLPLVMSLLNSVSRNANPAFGNELQSLSDSKAKNGCVVVFECNHCPYVVASVGRMNNMAEYCKVNGIGFIGINANDPDNYPADSFENMVKRAENGMPNFTSTMQLQEIATAWGRNERLSSSC